MRLFKCDVCGKETNDHGLWYLSINELKDIIEHLCFDCYEKYKAEISKIATKYQKLKDQEIKDYLLNQRRLNMLEK